MHLITARRACVWGEMNPSLGSLIWNRGQELLRVAGDRLSPTAGETRPCSCGCKAIFRGPDLAQMAFKSCARQQKMPVSFYLQLFNPLFIFTQSSLVHLDRLLHHGRHLIDLVYVCLHFLQDKM